MSAHEPALKPAVLRLVRARTGRSAWHSLLKFRISRIWTCWHRKMSRPFTRDGETYRVCIRCGMHRAFDVHAWKTKGPFYCASESLRWVTTNTEQVSELKEFRRAVPVNPRPATAARHEFPRLKRA
jgi:hypothetical protein